MIVKDEEHVIRGTLEKLVKQITFSYWVICDTGSTDKTREIITEFFKEQNIPGELLQHEWRDFGHNRTLALQGAYKKADYIFIFDADDTIHGTFKIPILTRDFYKLKFGHGFTYYRPLLVTAHKKTKFVGVLHEYLALEQGSPTEGTIEGDYYVDSGKTGSRSQDKDKYLKDALVLKAAYHKDVETKGGLANRYAFYCAQSFKDANKPDDAIEWYTLVADKLNSWVQERYYACIMLGFQYRGKGNFQKALEYFLKADQFDPERTEGVIFAIEMLKDANLHSLVMLLYEKHKNYNKNPKDKLFLFSDFYRDVLEFNVSISAFYAGNKQVSYDCIKKVIVNNIAQPGTLDRAFKNLRFHASELSDDPATLTMFYRLTDYIQMCDEPREASVLWDILFKKNRSLLTKSSKFNPNPNPSKKGVVLTLTSCKRLDLFTETVNSILNHWTDADQIETWFCVDDNSSKDDRVKMKKMYPWMTFYHKTLEEKGHRESMNIIWTKLNELKPRYWIHMEDDFLFHVKRSYVSDSIKFLNSQTNIKQVLFNRAYAETIRDVDMRGFLPITPGFVVHDYKIGQFPYRNCHYWPHYSFRPSMVDVESIMGLGNYDSPNTFFEMDYATKWVNAGYKSAFFDMVTCRHTGRLTSERNDKSVKNAYELNNESQFNKSKTTKVINLKRRPDRKEAMTKLFKDAEFTDYEFVDAVDGKELKATTELKKLFDGNDFGSRVGVLGCALSHYNLWKSLLASNDDYYVILEDDVSVTPKFKEKFKSLNEAFRKVDYLFLGYSMFSANRESTAEMYVKESSSLAIETLDKELYIGGFFAYSINRNGAKIMIDYIEKNGIKHGIDYVVKICPGLKCMELRPQIVFTEWYERVGQNVDTDIQKDNTQLDFNNIVEEFTFVQGVDQIGNDSFFKRGSIEEMKAIAMADPNCAGFNTLGFFKTNIHKNSLQPSQYFGEKDGIYIKNAAKKPLSLKLIGNWQTSRAMAQEFGSMGTDMELTWKDEADYYAIVNMPHAEEVYDPKKSIIFQMEPWVYDDKKRWGVKTWGPWANPDPSKFLHVHNRRFLNPAQWTLKGDLVNFPSKQNDACIILSHKKHDTGHKFRLDVVGGGKVDVYGKENYHSMLFYRGQVPDDNRYNVYSKYKYVVSVENNSEINYASEKIWEPLICECLPFYWGCPNLETYIDPQAFVRLPDDPLKAAEIIQQAVEEDWWSQRIDKIREAKKKVMSELGFFPVISRIISKC